MNHSSSWRTRFGFYLVAIGSAFSLGNLWRFPYVVGENGGGAFVLLYVFLCLIVGLPLLISELILGRITGSSVLMSMQKISPKNIQWAKWVGRFSVLLSVVVLSYYSVISGWVLHFITRFVFLGFSENPELLNLKTLTGNGWLQFLLASVHLLIVVFVLIKGIHEGLEKWISYVMPFFALMVVLLVIRTVFLPNNSDVFRFLFYPDFSKLSFASFNHAMGHVFFTLSVGFGTMITFGSYLRRDEHIPTAGYRLTLVDAVVSLVALLFVFPVAFQASGAPVTDPVLLFDVIPAYLSQINGGLFFGFFFFICLYFAALNATLGLFESVVANLIDLSNFTKKKLHRAQATWLSGFLVLFMAAGPSLFSSYYNKSLIEIMDSILINWILPLVVLGLCLAFNLYVPDEMKERNFVDRNKFVSYSMYSHWLIMIKYVVPTIILIGLFFQIFSKI